jgi:hypothetical protein
MIVVILFREYKYCLFLYRHVQVNNESAIQFYQKFGFSVVETKPAYYKRIEPADAHVLQKTLRTNNNSSEQTNRVGHTSSLLNGQPNSPITVNGQGK